MKNRDIVDEYKCRIKKVLKQYGDLFDKFSVEDNHNFRVEIKKLRAFLRLVTLASPEQPQKIPKSLKKFYNLVGDIRNLQLQDQRIDGLCEILLIRKPDVYLKCIHDEEDSKKKKAQKLKEDISLDDFEKKLADDVPEKLTVENKNALIENYRSRLTQLLALPCYFDETFHDIRKLLKDLMYNHGFLERAISTLMPPMLHDLATIEMLTSVLGDFHDLCMAFFFLSPSHLFELRNDNEKAVLDELSMYFNLRKENIKNEILNLLLALKDQIEKK
jgi:CHAD domain-containing protein